MILYILLHKMILLKYFHYRSVIKEIDKTDLVSIKM
jgi:hypothetical protein